MSSGATRTDLHHRNQRQHRENERLARELRELRDAVRDVIRYDLAALLFGQATAAEAVDLARGLWKVGPWKKLVELIPRNQEVTHGAPGESSELAEVRERAGKESSGPVAASRSDAIEAAARALETELARIGTTYGDTGEIGAWDDPVWSPDTVAARDRLRDVLSLKPFNTDEPA